MPSREVQHWILGGLAGGSLLTGIPWTRIFRAALKSVESDSVNLAVTVGANFLVESPTISRALSLLLLLAVLFVYSDLVYLRRLEPLTGRRDFRLLTAVIAGSVTFLFPQVPQHGWMVYSFMTLLFGGVAVFSVYLWFTPFAPFDPEGVILPYWTRMAGVILKRH